MGKVDGGEEGCSTSAKEKVHETLGLLAKACDTIRLVAKDHKEQLAVEKGRSVSLEVQVTNITG